MNDHMRIRLETIKNTLGEFEQQDELPHTGEIVPFKTHAPLSVIAEALWRALMVEQTEHPTVIDESLICPHCHKGVLRPDVIAGSMALGCDECPYQETA